MARGLHVIRFDNRDAGASTHFTGMPDFAAALRGDVSSAAYTLSDMARDAASLLEALRVERAHIVGASMGGQIAQHLAIEHPARVRSLTFVIIDGMGHGLPRVVWPRLADLVAGLVARVEGPQ